MDGSQSRSWPPVTNVARTVFYAWQSDCPSGTNRGFIREALDRAVKRLNEDDFEIEVDEGTAGVAGMPDISNEILKKIDQCSVFVADVTLVGRADEADSTKRLSNPSVMYELGYARKAHGEKQLVALVNTAFGRVEDLPFDIKNARVSPYTRHKPTEAGDTEPRQLVDLLCESLKLVLDEPTPENESSEDDPVAALKSLLPKPDGVIEVEDLIREHTESLVRKMVDEEKFPLGNSMASNSPAGYRYLADQATLYIDACLPLCELLATGVAFGDSSHDRVWQQTVGQVANVANQPRGGVMSLLDLRFLPLSMLAYSVLIAGVDRENYPAIRAALIDAGIRNEAKQKVPVISCVNPWRPFESAALVANIALIDAESGEMCDLDRIGRLICHTESHRFTPESDLLHVVLRKPLRRLIPDDEDYTEIFDKAEVLLALMTADAGADTVEYYVPSPYYGAFTWRYRMIQQKPFEKRFIDEASRSMSAWPILTSGLFGKDVTRFQSAAETVISGAKEARRRRN